MQEIRRHDAAMNGIAPAGDAGADHFLDQNFFMREGSTGAAIGFRDHRA